MLVLVLQVDLFPAAHWLGLSGALSEFELLISRQLNLVEEAENLHRFRQNFKDDTSICFPVRPLSYIPSPYSHTVFESTMYHWNLLSPDL